MPSETKVSVVIVDDHAIVREGIAEVLEQSGEFDVSRTGRRRRGSGRLKILRAENERSDHGHSAFPRRTESKPAAR